MTIMVLPWIMWINHYFTMDESIRTTRWTGGREYPKVCVNLQTDVR